MRGKSQLRHVPAGLGRVGLLVVGTALAVGGCGSGTQGGDDAAGSAANASKTASKPAGPDRALVTWAGRMCTVTQQFETLRKDSAGQLKAIDDPPAGAPIGPEFAAMGYLSDIPSSLDEVAQGLDGVRPSGIAAADRLHDGLAKEVERVQPKVTELSGTGAYTSPMEDSVGRAEQVGKLIASLKMPEPDLPAVVAGEPKLSAAYHAAPECAPPAPLPEASDGTDVGACKDGACEILVTKQADVVVGEWKLHVSLAGTKVTVGNRGPKGGVGQTTLGAGGTGTFGEADGTEVTVRAVGVTEDGAVLKFTTK